MPRQLTLITRCGWGKRAVAETLVGREAGDSGAFCLWPEINAAAVSRRPFRLVSCFERIP